MINFLFEISTLKRLPRLGHNMGVKNESITEHTFGKLPFSNDILKILAEYKEENRLRQKIASDTNILDLLVE